MPSMIRRASWSELRSTVPSTDAMSIKTFLEPELLHIVWEESRQIILDVVSRRSWEKSKSMELITATKVSQPNNAVTDFNYSQDGIPLWRRLIRSDIVWRSRESKQSKIVLQLLYIQQVLEAMYACSPGEDGIWQSACYSISPHHSLKSLMVAFGMEYKGCQ